MAQTPAITITGASGRMGQMLLQTVLNSDKARLVGAVERKGHPWVGRDVGEAMGGQAVGVVVTDEPLEAFALSQAVIDFTAPRRHAGICRPRRASPRRACHRNHWHERGRSRKARTGQPPRGDCACWEYVTWRKSSYEIDRKSRRRLG